MSQTPASGVRTAAYHRGDLRGTLLEAAETLLEQGGIPALTLRAVSRAAGVSHAAPAHHFGDLTGLLSDLAAAGFLRLAAAFETGMASEGEDAAARLTALGKVYVGFARTYPGMFALMFRSERLDMRRESLRMAADASRRTLLGAIGAPTGPDAPRSMEVVARFTALWSLVHGFAVLLTEKRLGGLIETLPPGEDADSLLAAVLDAVDVS